MNRALPLLLRTRMVIPSALLILPTLLHPPTSGWARAAPEPNHFGSPLAAGAAIPVLDTIPLGDTIPEVDPPLPTVDTIPPDTIPEVDPLLPTVDTIPPQEAPAAVEGEPDAVPPEQLEPHSVPRIGRGAPSGWETGVWEWSREEILANRALTLIDLLEQVPGLHALRGGDYGMPRAASAFGLGGGGLRVFWDGMEHLPLEGSVPDLSRIGLSGLERVRVERTPTGLRVDLESFQPDDPRPLSVVEAGTGDLDTNLFRGTFGHPRALGGSVAFSVDRVDTSGPQRQEPGAVSTLWLRYGLHRGDQGSLWAELRRGISNRGELFVPRDADRTDLSLRGRYELAPEVVADLFWSRSGLETEEDDLFPFLAEPRRQVGAQISARRGGAFGRVGVRSYGGEGLPASEVEVEAGFRRPDLGGALAEWTREGWQEASLGSFRARAWTAPRFGVSFFGEFLEGDRGVPYLPGLPEDPEEPEEPEEESPGEELEEPVSGSVPSVFHSAHRSGTRVGGRFDWRGLHLGVARLSIEADSVFPLGLPMDGEGDAVGGGSRVGYEGQFRVPLLLLDNLALEGSVQLWEELEEPWPYSPERSWDGRITFHDVFLPTGNLEVWFDLGVQGRDGMTMPFFEESEDPEVRVPSAVPSYLVWYTRLQIRVVTVRIFVNWENYTLRQDNQDFPGRVLPATRAMYGVRWTLWN